MSDDCFLCIISRYSGTGHGRMRNCKGDFKSKKVTITGVVLDKAANIL